MTAIYNEIDIDAADVLRQLIADDVIAPGVVNTTSIKDLTANDLRGFTQCHFFAGGGLWSVAARLAGWPDDRPLWTASCPCQPFSQAGKGAGVNDERHLWPDVDRLVREAHVAGFGPRVIVGEQVSGAAGADWFDGVASDLARQGYKIGSRDIPSCAVDAPNIRQRQYWIAVSGSLEDAEQQGKRGRELQRCGQGDCTASSRPANQLGRSDGDRTSQGVTLGDAFEQGLEGQPRHGDGTTGRQITYRPVATADDGHYGRVSVHSLNSFDNQTASLSALPSTLNERAG